MEQQTRERHCSKKQLPVGKTSGEKNIFHTTLTDPKKFLLPPLHLKLDLMKLFIKALTQDGGFFKYFSRQFSHLLQTKLNEGIFVESYIRNLEVSMSTKEKEA